MRFQIAEIGHFGEGVPIDWGPGAFSESGDGRAGAKPWPVDDILAFAWGVALAILVIFIGDLRVSDGGVIFYESLGQDYFITIISQFLQDWL